MVHPFTSQKFRFWSFVSMFLLVFVHGYNLEIRYLEPWTMPGEPLTITGFTEYFLANGIFRFRIPMLFAISGYLFALHDQTPHPVRMKKRLRTLLLPYLLWSAFAILMCFGLELIPYSRNLIANSHVLQIDESKVLIHDYAWYEVLARWIVFPVSYQLWFLRVLLIYNLAYPAIRYLVTNKTARRIFFPIAFLLWLSTFGLLFIEGEGLLFFSLGVWLQKSGTSIETPLRGTAPAPWGAVIISMALIKTLLAFNGADLLGSYQEPVLTILHKGVVASGLIACWYGCDGWVRWCMARPWFVWLSAFSFVIYTLHAPLVAFAINGVLDILLPVKGAHLITFFVLPLAIIIFCIAVGAVLRTISPSLYGIITGGRGLGGSI